MAAKNTKKEAARCAALYCRVSTIDQGKADFSSLDTQEQMLRAECASKGWKVFRVYADTKSGATLERPELERLLHDAEQEHFDVILATKLDRISRSVKDFLELDDRLGKLGVDVVITTQHIDTTTPQGTMLRNILMAFAQFEREMIAERTRESAYARAQKGFWLGGNVPLGYDVVEKKLVANNEEAKLVRKIFEMYLETPSTKAVARNLNKNGYRTKVRRTRNGQTIGGGEFGHQLVHDILRNRIYTGQIKVNNEVFKGLHDDIVDEKLFARVQDRLDRSAVDTYSTYEGSPLLLLGTTKCGFCGANLTTYHATNGKDKVKHYYYKCTTVIKQGSHKCPSRLVPARELESFTRDLMLHTVREKGFFEAITSQIKDNSDDEIKQMNEERQELQGNLSAVQRKIDNILGNLADGIVGATVKKQLAEMLEDLENQKSTISSGIAELDTRIADVGETKFRKQALSRVLAEFGTLFEEASSEDKTRMLKTVISEIKVSAKSRETDGTLEFRLRGDGQLLRRWDQVINKRGAGLTPRVGWLRE
jgi:site-specific DNA recombinase